MTRGVIKPRITQISRIISRTDYQKSTVPLKEGQFLLISPA